MLIFASAALVGCDSSFKNHRAYPSPDGKHIVEVVTEFDRKKEPETWWQHVSLHEGKTPKRNQKGNLFIYSGSTQPEITWNDNTQIVIVFRNVGQIFQGPFDRAEANSIGLNMKIEQAVAQDPGPPPKP